MKDRNQQFSIFPKNPDLGFLLGQLIPFAVKPLDHLLALPQLEKIYADVLSRLNNEENTNSFVRCVLEEMKIEDSVRNNSLDRIPKSGPLIVVSNHPFGAIEALILLETLRKVRSDVKFLANFMLGRIPETADYCIYVDPFGKNDSAKKNIQPIRESIGWVADGGVLCVFPSGTVSFFNWKMRSISDPAWSQTVGRLVRKTAAPVMPVFFSGSNSLSFQLAGMIHPAIRTLLLPRQLYNKRNSKINLSLGKPIAFEKLNRFSSDEEMVSYLRLRTYIQANTNKSNIKSDYRRTFAVFRQRSRKVLPVIAPVNPQVMEREISGIPTEQFLLENGANVVIYAKANQIPAVLREIGRLREISFRQVNEGTGKNLDLDQFDKYYIHLFIWNRKTREVIGAYRLGMTDQILSQFGKSGLYTSSLFAYRTELLEQINPALEVGRSFVRAEYQKNYSPLLLLWKGIAHFVLLNPRYRFLFGPVSINNEYDSISRQLIAAFLKQNNYLPDLAKLIKARNPLRSTPLLGMDLKTTSVVVKDINDVSELLEAIEAKHKTIPILLKQYLKLGGKLMGFNVDPSFGDVLDGLIFIDLVDTDYKLLERYMSRDGAARFLQYHGREPNKERRTGT